MEFSIDILNKAFDQLAVSHHEDEEERLLEEAYGQKQQVLVSEAAKSIRDYVKEKHPQGAIGTGLSREIIAAIGGKLNESAEGNNGK